MYSNKLQFSCVPRWTKLLSSWIECTDYGDACQTKKGVLKWKYCQLWNLKSPFEKSLNKLLKIPVAVIVESVSHDMIWDFLDTTYLQKCPSIQPIKEIEAKSSHSRLIYYRSTYNEVVSGIIRKRNNTNTSLRDGEFVLPNPAYDGK